MNKPVVCRGCEHYVAVNDYCRKIKRGVNPYAYIFCEHYRQWRIKQWQQKQRKRQKSLS